MEDGGWRMEDGGWRMEDGGWRMEDGGWRMEDGGWRMEDGGWRMEDGGWRMEDRALLVPKLRLGTRVKSGAEKWVLEDLCSAISNGDFFAILFFCLPFGCPPEAERPRRVY